MKKIKILFLVMLLAFSFVLVSCDEDGNVKGDSGSCTHNLTNTQVVKNSTCTESGLLGGTCSKCGTYATESFSPAGHNFVDGTCTVCGEVENADS